jgi:5,10-methylenetetrahydrofolate reductase
LEAATLAGPGRLGGAIQDVTHRVSDRDQLGDLRTRFAARRSTVTIELGTPRLHDEADAERYRRQVDQYQQLLDAGWIDGVTVRDAPDLGQWKTWLVRRALVPLSQHMQLPFSEVMREVDSFVDVRDLRPSPPAFVATVGAQDRSRREVQERMLNAIHHHQAQALFFVGGGHPYRKVAWARRFLPMNTLKLLDLARQLRRTGDLPADLPLWASWDPFHEPDHGRGLDWLVRKIDHGASAILTQPPLLRASFERWVREAERRGVFERAELKVGVPLIISSRNLIFWYQLIGISSAEPEARHAVAAWRRAEAAGTQHQFTLEWNGELTRWAWDLPGTTGLHLMPVHAWRRTRAVLEHSGLTPAFRLDQDAEVANQGPIGAVSH